ncbi:MAG: L-serine ammonia-lyase, iron-sulfur-dependent, subunit beta [Cytophagales bacterium]|nr:L-serine ammonia-lyase, iron-sulfur-dependent, subunit beta [Cytophagales bacterium]
MAEPSSIFDMIGPVMIGPSSSHTGGVVRIGRVANRILGGIPNQATITFYNSFARTYEGHGSNRAILAGLMNFKPDDERIKDALNIAKDAGMKYNFKSVGSASTFHPNTVRVELKKGDELTEMLGESRGGGVIRIKEVDGFDANFTASSHTLIFEADDVPGSVSFISDVLSRDDCNIATMTVSREEKAGKACLILEMDTGPKDLTVRYLSNLNWVRKVISMPNMD